MATGIARRDEKIRPRESGNFNWRNWDITRIQELPETPAKILYVVSKVETPTQIRLSICGINYIIDNRLSHIADAIRKSKELLTLKDDWDEDGANGINETIYVRAIETLIRYSDNILDTYKTAIKAPYISLGRDGSIDLDWSTPNNQLLITILNTGNFNLHYYGDDGNNNTVIKGTLEGLVINDDLSHWMRKL